MPPTLLAKALFRLIRCYVIVLLVIWLAIFAPLICQYHGLMLHSSGETHAEDAMNTVAGASSRSGLFDTASGLAAQLQHTHSFDSTVTLLMNLLLVAMPTRLAFYRRAPVTIMRVARIRLPRQFRDPPPEQPPRLQSC